MQELLECWTNHIFICLWEVAEEQESKKANPSKFQLEEQIIAVPRNGNKKCGELRVIIHVKPVSVSHSPSVSPHTKCQSQNEILSTFPHLHHYHWHCSSCVFHKVTQYNNYSNFVTNKNEKKFELQSPYHFRINSGDISCLPLTDRTKVLPKATQYLLLTSH